MVCLENDSLKVWIRPKGAELKSIVHKATGTEHLWDANPAFWAKSSPVLFPIVGALKDNTYQFQGKSYELGRHGFGRDHVFEVESKNKTTATFLFCSNEDTLKAYPFEFQLRIIYTLEEGKLSVNYHVTNSGNSEMYFSIGGHPAFTVPFDSNTNYGDYSILFNKEEVLNRWLLSPQGLLNGQTQPVELEEGKLKITKELFKDDALVFKYLESNELTLKSEKESKSLIFRFENFPYFGIWAAKNAPFICLEPWCGIADSESHNQELTDKEGIEKLMAGSVFERVWSVEVK
ncbi:MAG: aldose 1-epimerase family protein [Cytophagales bacterium]|nr:aldose 1-epimerase family protein [Cytophagales bacterium]